MAQLLASALEILYRPFMAFCCLAAAERAEIPALAGLRIRLARIKAVFPRFQLSDHRRTSTSRPCGSNVCWEGWFPPRSALEGAMMHAWPATAQNPHSPWPRFPRIFAD